jgi:Arc/MetJ-type ribon-helix-helix transcriptional regulator
MRRNSAFSTITTRVPESFRGAIEAAATRAYTSNAAFVRQALAEKLQREGLIPVEGADVRRPRLDDAA